MERTVFRSMLLFHVLCIGSKSIDKSKKMHYNKSYVYIFGLYDIFLAGNTKKIYEKEIKAFANSERNDGFKQRKIHREN